MKLSKIHASLRAIPGENVCRHFQGNILLIPSTSYIKHQVLTLINGRVDRTRLEKLLSIEKGASSEAIKKAYRRTAIRYHPSRYPPVTDPPFEKISDAYYILSDPQKRAIYDVYGIEGIECLEPVPSGLHYNVFSN